MSERWYHGGVPGLKRGEKILPPAVTGATSTTTVALLPGNEDIRDGALANHRDDRVYLAASDADARLWAALHPAYMGRHKGGDLYEVTPDGPLEPDPDYLADDGGSVCCESATVVRIVERRVPRETGLRMLTGRTT